MNGEILRGEVYWVCLDDSVGSEEKTGRPAVVVSADGINSKMNVVTVAFLTTGASMALPSRPTVVSPTGVKRRVLCEQLRTIDKSRLDHYDSTLSESEMIRVTGALAGVMCIPLPVSNPKPIVKSDAEETITSLRCEAEMWRRMYEKTMDQLVELRVNTAVARLTERAMEPVLEPLVQEPIEKSIVKSALVEPDLGFEEESENPESKQGKKRQKNSIEWDGVKVNVNTVPTAVELRNRTGMALNTAQEIIKTRKIVGKYDTLKDLLALDKFGERSMKRYGHMLEV